MSDSIGSDVGKAIGDLRDRPGGAALYGLVLDLRKNPGGVLEAAVDVVEQHLARIDALDSKLHAFITVTAETAMARLPLAGQCAAGQREIVKAGHKREECQGGP